MNIYFVGAGGIGMANLVRYYYMRHGVAVAGYDRTPRNSPMSSSGKGRSLTFKADETEIPAGFRNPAGNPLWSTLLPCLNPILYSNTSATTDSKW